MSKRKTSKPSRPTKPSPPMKPAPRSKSTEAPPGSAANPVQLVDGTWRFTVQKDGEAHECSVDTMMLKLEIEKLEQQHGIVPQDGMLRPTVEFMRDLVAVLETMGVPATPVIAYQLYSKMGIQFTELMAKISATP
jgi:hypothetical protein